MKRTNKKGFTIVELVIVIAVIAILAAVLIPNLSRLVEKANESKALQQAKAAYEAYLLKDEATTSEDGRKTTPAEHLDNIYLCIKSGDFYFHVNAGQFSSVATKAADHASSHESGKTYTSMTVNSGELGTVAP